jgi:hypothetical protein
MVVADESKPNHLVGAQREDHRNHEFLKGVYFEDMSKKKMYQMTMLIGK